MKKIIMSLAIIVTVGAVVATFTRAFFSDVETSVGNTFTAGGIDLTIDNESYVTNKAGELVKSDSTSWVLDNLDGQDHLFFDFDDLKPGDRGEDTISLHVNDNDAWACMKITITDTLENELTGPEALVDNTIGEQEGELQNELHFVFWGDDGDNVFEDDEVSNVFAEGVAADMFSGDYWPLADTSGNNVWGGNDALSGGDIHYIAKYWCYGDLVKVPQAQGDNNPLTNTGFTCNGSGTGNISQTDGIMADVEFYAIQSRNNDNFVCSDMNGDDDVEKCVSVTEDCSDQTDNDCDGFVDCYDKDCVEDPACEIAVETNTVTLENKNSSWVAIENDNIYGDLTYNPSGPTFDYNFKAYGLVPSGNYNLIYYPDPWGDPKTIVLIGGTLSADSFGNIDSGDQSVELGMDLPNSTTGFDGNYPTGAKIWLVSSGNLSGNIFDWTGITNLLLEMGWANYDDTDVANFETIALADIGALSQYGYFHDYSGANVDFTYATPAADKLTGTITASGLKPYATYQLKFEGKPVCKYGVAGDDVANEQIGYMGRWWDDTSNSNTSDAGYLANSTYYGGTHCISGYLVWGFITADASGNATKVVTTDSSYHVLWCSGGTCGQTNNTQLAFLDPAYPALNLCAAGDVNGEIERSSCGGLTFASGDYNLNMILNEESFHQGPGTWTAVMNMDIEFEIE